MQALAAEFSGSARKIPLLFRLKQADAQRRLKSFLARIELVASPFALFLRAISLEILRAKVEHPSGLRLIYASGRSVRTAVSRARFSRRGPRSR